MGNDGHNGNLRVVELQKSPTSITNCEHLGDFGVKSASGVKWKKLAQ